MVWFTAPKTAELIEQNVKEIKGDLVLVDTEYTAVSGGTERANILGLPNAGGNNFPKVLGCTRISDCPIDYYQQVHRPGIKLIGAHNFVRPKVESYPHHWTHHDDCRAILDMISTGRIDVRSIISRVVSPKACHEIFTQLCEDKNFPLGTVFDWRTL